MADDSKIQANSNTRSDENWMNLKLDLKLDLNLNLNLNLDLDLNLDLNLEWGVLWIRNRGAECGCNSCQKGYVINDKAMVKDGFRGVHGSLLRNRELGCG